MSLPHFVDSVLLRVKHSEVQTRTPGTSQAGSSAMNCLFTGFQACLNAGDEGMATSYRSLSASTLQGHR